MNSYFYELIIVTKSVSGQISCGQYLTFRI